MKIAIVGMATSSKDLAPFEDPSWDIWTLNDNYHSLKRFNKQFEIHPPETVNNHPRSKGYREDLTAMVRDGVPVYLYDETVIDGCLAFPFDSILERFGGVSGKKYFTNTVSWLIAFAIMEWEAAGKPEAELGIWGVDMAHTTEYGKQKPSCEYWIGVAEGLGMKVTIPEQCELLKTSHMYAYDWPKNGFFKIHARKEEYKKRHAEAERRLADLRAKARQAELDESFVAGILHNADYVLENWGPIK